jgi:hypothetical protein
MGTLRSNNSISGFEYNGVVLGESIEENGIYNYDHERFPNGVVEIIDNKILVIPDKVDEA